jgi:hypothetical protein
MQVEMQEIKTRTLTKLDVDGRFLSRKTLKKYFPEVAVMFKSSHRVLGAIWNKNEKKLHVLLYDSFFNEIEMWTFDVV